MNNRQKISIIIYCLILLTILLFPHFVIQGQQATISDGFHFLFPLGPKGTISIDVNYAQSLFSALRESGYSDLPDETTFRNRLKNENEYRVRAWRIARGRSLSNIGDDPDQFNDLLAGKKPSLREPKDPMSKPNWQLMLVEVLIVSLIELALLFALKPEKPK